MSAAGNSRVVEDYVTLIWKACEWPGDAPSTTSLAAQLGVTPSTVSTTLKKLAQAGLILYQPYGSFELTDQGRAIAVPIVRRHRILETYLARMLDMPWEEVHDEADRLEHAISDALLNRLDTVLGHPTHDPHGDPIPDADGNVAVVVDQLLAETAPGTRVRISRISDRSSQVLRHLESLNLVIGAVVTIEEINRAADAIVLTRNGVQIQVSLRIAAAILVAPIRDDIHGNIRPS